MVRRPAVSAIARSSSVVFPEPGELTTLTAKIPRASNQARLWAAMWLLRERTSCSRRIRRGSMSGGWVGVGEGSWEGVGWGAWLWERPGCAGGMRGGFMWGWWLGWGGGSWEWLGWGAWLWEWS